MPLRTFNEYMRPVLEVIEGYRQGPLALAKIREMVLDATGATGEDRGRKTDSDHPLLQGRIDWAVTYLTHAGLLERVSRATYNITEAGMDALRSAPAVFTVGWLHDQSASFREFQSRTRKEPPPIKTNEQTPDEMIDAGMESLKESVRGDLSDALSGLSSSSFEQLAVTVLAAVMKYSPDDARAVVTSPTGDGGVDGVLYADPLELQRLYVQAKWWESGTTVSRPEIDKFLGALTRLGATAGVFVTSSTFSEGARHATDGLSTRIKLIDRNELLELMFKCGIGVVPDRQFETKRFDPGFFETL